MEEIQKPILDIFWSGKHWVQAEALLLPVAGFDPVQDCLIQTLYQTEAALWLCVQAGWTLLDCC